MQNTSERTRQKIAAKTAPRMRSVVNATGTVTHTNLGRALLSDDACEAIQQAAQNYVNLEYDIETGQRGTSRSDHRTASTAVDRVRSFHGRQ